MLRVLREALPWVALALLVACAEPPAAEEPSAPLPAPPPGAAQDPTTLTLPLSGTGPADALPWQFRCASGRGCGKAWTTIPVPSNWELMGFGTYDYGHVEERAADVGHYRHSFVVPASWRGRRVELVFGGVMTDTEVEVNGERAGPRHLGGFTEFRRDVSQLLRFGAENLLELKVDEGSADRSIELAERDADYWTFGGVFRPVWLEARPPESIAHVAIDAGHDGALRVRLALDSVAPGARVVARVEKESGASLGAPFEAGVEGSSLELAAALPSPLPWSDERPNLYRLVLELRRGDRLLHRVSRRFGFRTVEVRPGEGLYVNGVRRLLRGVNRHVFRPATGRAIDPAESRADAELLRALNLNAVRTAHYPPDPAFLDACDELGIYVFDELPGWHDAYSTRIGRPLVREMVARDVNHPSIIFWTNGNEGGSNAKLDAEFARHDPQRRPVLHPDALRAAIDTHHYPTFAELRARLDPASWLSRWRSLAGKLPLYLPTEALHGLYDGGGAAGLELYWEEIRRSPLGAGIVLWALADESVVRTDRGGALDSDGNHAPDGLVGPHHEATGSAAAVRAIFAPVQFRELDAGKAELAVENRFAETNLQGLEFRWELRDLPEVGSGQGEVRSLVSGALAGPDVGPGAQGRLSFELPASWREADALAVAAVDAKGREVGRHVVPLGSREWATAGPAAEPGERGGPLAELDTPSGRLRGLTVRGQRLELAGPECLAGSSSGGPGEARRQWQHAGDGWLRLTYSCPEAAPDDELAGIGFALPAANVLALRFVGNGPGGVWANRLAGPEFGFWSKSRGPETSFGALADLPGFYSGVRWAELEFEHGTLEIAIEDDDVALGVSAPAFPADAKQAVAKLPARDSLSFADRLPPIGDKFRTPAELGFGPREPAPPRERSLRLRWTARHGPPAPPSP